MAPFLGDPTYAQQVAMAITPKVSGFLSLLGSGYIVYDCYRQLKTAQGGSGITLSANSSAHIYQRLMIGMSLSDMIMSFSFVLSTLPMPRGTPNTWGALGTTGSCSFIGSFTMMGVVPVMYNASLSIYYLLRIRNGWTLSQLHAVEKWLHCVPWVWGLLTVIAGLSLKLFNSGLFECWLAPFPQGCTPTYQSTPDNPPTCTRGDNVILYQWGFDMIPKLSSILIVTVNMYLTWLSLYRQEKQTNRFSMGKMPSMQMSATSDNRSSNLKKTSTRSSVQLVKLSVAQRLARQSYFYVGALYITYIPVIVARLNEAATGYVHWEMLYVISMLVPAQGFWNAMVYLRPRYLQYRQDEVKKTRASLAASSINISSATAPLSTVTSNFEEPSSSRDSEAPPAPRKNVFQTIGEAFRDGAIDDERELTLAEADVANAGQPPVIPEGAEDEASERQEPSNLQCLAPGDDPEALPKLPASDGSAE